MQSRFLCLAFAATFAQWQPAQAGVISFDTDPFAGSTALTTPGRQIVGSEPSVAFSISDDVFTFEQSIFGMGGNIALGNDTAANLGTSGLNAIVLRSFDNDNDAATPFNAGTAANLIAAQLTNDGAGVFVYFNSGLDLARLVFSTNLNDNTADLKILARLTNFNGQAGRDAMAQLTADNFSIVNTQAVPEPGSLALLASALTALATTGALARRVRKPAS